jgi:hypothetical protein
MEIRVRPLRSLCVAEFGVEMVKARNKDMGRLIGAIRYLMMDNNEWGTYGERYSL